MKIKVRDLSLNDIQIINKWHNSRELFTFLVGNYYGPTKKETYDWISKYTREKHTFRGVVSDETGKDIGIIYLIRKSVANKAELGIFIAEEKDRHKGYGKIMLEWVLNLGFNVLKLDEIFLYVLEANEHAIRLYKKYCFKEDTTLSIFVKKEGKISKASYMHLGREDYVKKYN